MVSIREDAGFTALTAASASAASSGSTRAATLNWISFPAMAPLSFSHLPLFRGSGWWVWFGG